MQIWTFWEGPENEAVEDSLNTWRANLPGWSITVLNTSQFLNLGLPVPSTFAQQTPTTKSDVARLAVLFAYGGLWMDASILLRRPLDWLNLSSHAVTAFRIKGRRHIENWFLCAPAAHDVGIGKWAAALDSILEYYPEFERAPAYQQAEVVDRPRYFMSYQAYLHLLNVDPEFLAWDAAVHTESATPHFCLLHPRMTKLTRRLRGIYNRRRATAALTAAVTGAILVILLAAWQLR